MEVQSRTLIQERAILVARQGDPKSPAPGTLLARQKILHSELESAHARSSGNLGGGVAVATNRHPEQIRRDIRRIERELISVQARLREIDSQISADDDKSTD